MLFRSKAYQEGAVAFAKEHGYSITTFGRRRPIPELKESNFMRRQFGERVAMNAPIQGTAADIMKIAMIRVFERLIRRRFRSAGPRNAKILPILSSRRNTDICAAGSAAGRNILCPSCRSKENSRSVMSIPQFRICSAREWRNISAWRPHSGRTKFPILMRERFWNLMLWRPRCPFS